MVILGLLLISHGKKLEELAINVDVCNAVNFGKLQISGIEYMKLNGVYFLLILKKIIHADLWKLCNNQNLKKSFRLCINLQRLRSEIKYTSN